MVSSVIQAARVDSSPARDCWRTPRPLFEALNRRHRFDRDGAADESNHLLPAYWSEADDGILHLLEWDDDKERVFVNPPYSDLKPWLVASWARAVRGAFTALLLPVRADQGWWHDYALRGELHYFRGRIQFEPPPGVAKSSNSAASVLVVFDPRTLDLGVARSLDAKTGELL